MGLLRAATRLGATGARRMAPTVGRTATAPIVSPFANVACRTIMTRSMPRMGHNLEDHFDMAEYICRMHNPLGEYLIWFIASSMFLVAFGPLLHSNYYFTGRFLPKDQGNTQLCDDSW
mmetsp:Transcript_16347/g.49179  ORF Transcript_16347/g.49179 Transcript_16347/m.49179 type:complete len:118 (-) Transcript_16347:214-567(-)